MNINGLKDFLRARCLPISGNKEALKSRAFAAMEMNIPVELSGQEYIKNRQEQYNEIMQRVGLKDDPLLNDSGWQGEQSGIQKWPNFTLVQHTEWLNKQEQLTKQKLDKAYNFFTSGFAKEVFIKDLSSTEVIFKNSCTHSQAMSAIPHQCWLVLIKETARVVAAYCTCVAG